MGEEDHLRIELLEREFGRRVILRLPSDFEFSFLDEYRKLTQLRVPAAVVEVQMRIRDIGPGQRSEPGGQGIFQPDSAGRWWASTSGWEPMPVVSADAYAALK